MFSYTVTAYIMLHAAERTVKFHSMLPLARMSSSKRSNVAAMNTDEVCTHSGV